MRPTYTAGKESPAREPSWSAFWLQKPSILRVCVREEDAGRRETGAHSTKCVDFGLWSDDSHGYVIIRKAQRRIQEDERRPGRRSSGFPPLALQAGATLMTWPCVIRIPPARSCNAGRAGLVDGTGYPVRSWGVDLVYHHQTKFREVASKGPLDVLLRRCVETND